MTVWEEAPNRSMIHHSSKWRYWDPYGILWEVSTYSFSRKVKTVFPEQPRPQKFGEVEWLSKMNESPQWTMSPLLIRSNCADCQWDGKPALCDNHMAWAIFPDAALGHQAVKEKWWLNAFNFISLKLTNMADCPQLAILVRHNSELPT